MIIPFQDDSQMPQIALVIVESLKWSKFGRGTLDQMTCGSHREKKAAMFNTCIEYN